MKMKKILNEWNKFLLNEGKRKQTLQDKELRAPAGWFTKWNHRMGLIELSDWKNYIEGKYKDLQLEQSIIDKTTNKKISDEFIKNAINSIKSGYGYYVKLYLPEGEYENLVNKKLHEYFYSPPDSVPPGDKEFLNNNFNWIFDYGIQTAVANKNVQWNEYINPGYSGKVAFYGMSKDWYMFGEGIKETWEITQRYMKTNEKAISDLIRTELAAISDQANSPKKEQ